MDELKRLQEKVAQYEKEIARLTLRVEELDDFMENGSLPLHWVSSKGIILWANQAELDLLGYDKEEYIGYPIADFHCDHQVITDILSRLGGHETIQNYRARLKCKNGNVKHVLINSNVLVRNGEFIHTRCFTRDISEIVLKEEEQIDLLKKLKESEAHFRHLADLVPAKISNALSSGEVTFFNKQWLSFSGMNFDDLRDFGYHQMMHPDEIDDFKRGLMQAAETGVPFESEMRFKNIEGKYIWHLNIASPVVDENGTLKMWVGSTTDIQKLKEEEQRKSEFVSMVSHELKTPVTSIKAHIQLLLRIIEEEQGHSYPLQLKPSLERVDKLISQLTSLISEMLDLGRIETKNLELKRSKINLNNLVVDVIDDFRFTHPTHTVQLNQQIHCDVHVDKDKIVQVLVNFLSNAVKYAPDSFVIDMAIFEVSDGRVAVSIKDYGIGIDKKEHQKIFERFYRVEGNVEDRIRGFGIGLFIVWSIIESHQGIVLLESEKEQGSTFTFILPVAG